MVTDWLPSWPARSFWSRNACNTGMLRTLQALSDDTRVHVPLEIEKSRHPPTFVTHGAVMTAVSMLNAM